MRKRLLLKALVLAASAVGGMMPFYAKAQHKLTSYAGCMQGPSGGYCGPSWITNCQGC